MAEGLEGVVATTTRLSDVDGEAGRLTIAGYAVEDLAPYARFEEVAYLLLHGRLPEPSERARFAQDLAGRRALSRAAVEILQEAAAAHVPPMDALRMAAPVLSLGREENPVDDAMTAIASFPTIVGAYWRIRSGLAPVPVRSDIAHATHYLHQLFGATPSVEPARALETYLNTVCDHGLNASTFAARVIVSTRSDVISAITGAVGALKGPLHGGAPGPALDTVLEIGTPERAEAVIRAKLDRGERLMGFGHRIYRVRDPRADVLAQAAERFYSSDGDRSPSARQTFTTIALPSALRSEEAPIVRGQFAQLPPTLRGVRVRGTKPRDVVAFQGWCVSAFGARLGTDVAASGGRAAASAAALARAAVARASSFSRQQCLYLRPEPQWQGSLRPGRALVG